MRAGCCDSVAFGCGPRPRYATCEIRGFRPEIFAGREEIRWEEGKDEDQEEDEWGTTECG